MLEWDILLINRQKLGNGGLKKRDKGDNNAEFLYKRGMTLSFLELVFLEWLFLLAAGMTFMGGIRGALAATVILSGIVWMKHPTNFWAWERLLLIGVSISLGILMLLIRKAGKSELVAGLAGGLASLVVFGAFFTPFLALLSWALVVGTGLIPKFRVKQVFWGMAPMLWRVVIGVGWIVFGNILL